MGRTKLPSQIWVDTRIREAMNKLYTPHKSFPVSFGNTEFLVRLLKPESFIWTVKTKPVFPLWNQRQRLFFFLSTFWSYLLHRSWPEIWLWKQVAAYWNFLLVFPPTAGLYFPQIRLLMALVTKISPFHEMFSCELTSLSSYSSMLFIIYYVTLT